MRPLALCAAAALFLCGCSASRGTTPKPDHAKAVDALKLVVRLHSAATQADFAAFQSKVDKAYNDTLSGYYGAQEAGFVYSLSPAGAANPFSAIEVSCITRETHAEKAQAQCEKFLELLKQ